MAMSTAPCSRPPRQAPGVVKVRLAGALPDLAALTGLLAAVPFIEILTGPDGPYPNRRDAGERVYLTARIHPPSTTSPHGASAGPPRNPAAPLPHTPPRSLQGGTRHDRS